MSRKKQFSSFLTILIPLGLGFVPAGVPASLAQSEDLTYLSGEGDGVGMTVEDALANALRLVDALEKDEKGASDEEREADAAEATRLARFVLSKNPLDKTAGYVLGRISLMRGRLREALAAIESYVGSDLEPGPGRNDWYAHDLLGELRLVSYAQLARPEFEKAIKLAPSEAKPLAGLAKTELKLNHAPEAIENIQKAIQLDRENKPEYRITLAKALKLNKQFEEAMAAAREAVELGEQRVRDEPGEPDRLLELKEYYGVYLDTVQALAGQYPERADYVLKYVRVQQDQADLERLMSYHQAIATLKQARQYEGLQVTPDLLYEEARLNHIVGRDDDALKLLDELLKDSPNFDPAKNLLELLRPSMASDSTPSQNPS